MKDTIVKLETARYARELGFDGIRSITISLILMSVEQTVKHGMVQSIWICWCCTKTFILVWTATL